MNITSYTAMIITFHHLSATACLILAIIFSGLIYWLFIKRRKNRFLAVILTFLVSIILGATITAKIFHKQPVSFEIVHAG
jgi:Na+/phosphate symporter